MTQTMQSAAVQTAINVFQARPLARRAVRNGMPAREAAWHAAMGVMLFNAIGVVVIWWLLTGLPVLWLLVSGLADGPALFVARAAVAGTDLAMVAAIAVGGSLWALNNPARLTSWRRTLAQPLLILGLMLAYLPMQLVLLGLAKVLVG